ncbi:MAG: permease-like cell division protein FtsX [Patescibacteria group bacterium]
MTTAWRIFAASWKHFARNLWIGLATVFVFTVALLSVNVLIATNVMLEQTVAYFEEKIDVTITFQPDTPEALLTQARFYVQSFPQTESVRLVTPQEAYDAFKERYKSNAKILEAVTELSVNPLGAQLIIKAKETKDYPFLLSAVRNPQFEPFIRSSSYDDHRDAISSIRDAARSMRLFGSGLVAVFALFGLLAAFNAIRVAIYTQREEIAIMRLVGASSAYIRLPFVLEGVWLATLACVVTALSVWAAIQVGEPRLQTMFAGSDPGIMAFYVANRSFLVFTQFGIMAALSAMVSWIAVGRYIKR